MDPHRTNESWMVLEQRRRWWTGRVTSAHVLCEVPLLVRVRPTWKTLTCWNLPWCFTLGDVESILEKQHKSPVIIDDKSLYDALERSESSTRNLTERRTAIEVTAIRQRLEHGFIYTAWVTSDRQNGDHVCQKSWKLSGTRLSKVQESSRWQDGQKAKEILMGDEFSMTVGLEHRCNEIQNSQLLSIWRFIERRHS